MEKWKNNRIVKIAFIDHLAVGTGIVRYATQLANHLILLDKNLRIDFYTHDSNFNNNIELYKDQAFKVKILVSTKPINLRGKIFNKIRKTCGVSIRDRLTSELNSLKNYDVFYFTSAHMSKYYEMKGTKVATFHDFNWKYSFGLPTFSKQDVAKLNFEMKAWIEDTVPIVSSDFMKKELIKFYGNNLLNNIEVIYLPNLAQESNLESDSLPKEITYPYLLCPASMYSHKNHFNIYQALFKLKQSGMLNRFKLVLTGHNSDHFRYAKLCSEGVMQADENDYDVLGLGYVNNNEMDSLIKNAAVNISASFYEAGSGPALDAWINESPVIISNIESHLNQLSFFKIDCITFNPVDFNDIADKIAFALDNLSMLKKQSENAKIALKQYDWNEASKKYLKVFKHYAN